MMITGGSNIWCDGTAAGLSWKTISFTGGGYRRAFDGFDPGKVAQYDDKKFNELLNDEGIIRNRLKIKSAINMRKHTFGSGKSSRF
jgi:DNA-3-methyladenine glycosylase I